MQNSNHQIKDINTYILYVLYFLINALFITKYLMRISLSVTLLVLSAYLLAGLLLPRLAARVGHVGSRSLWFAILGFILVLAGMQYLIDPYQIQVDRWSAIHNFINYLVHGRYPYMAPTHLGGYGSPFPVWQFLHIPFYYLNNVGLSLFAVLAFTLYTVNRLYGNRATLCFLACLLFFFVFFLFIHPSRTLFPPAGNAAQHAVGSRHSVLHLPAAPLPFIKPSEENKLLIGNFPDIQPHVSPLPAVGYEESAVLRIQSLRPADPPGQPVGYSPADTCHDLSRIQLAGQQKKTVWQHRLRTLPPHRRHVHHQYGNIGQLPAVQSHIRHLLFQHVAAIHHHSKHQKVMKLSIIIPVYRTQDTLERCLESILQQSFTDYEMILVDDGSDAVSPQL